MIAYSDYVLARKPFSYCRMQEPLGYYVFCDVSGNRNHLYKGHYDDALKKNVFEDGGMVSQYSLDFIGEPNIKGMRPAGHTYPLNPTITNYQEFLYYTGMPFTFHDTGNTPNISLRADQICFEFLFKGLEPPSNNRYSVVASLGPIRIANEMLNGIHYLRIVVVESNNSNPDLDYWYTTIYLRNLTDDPISSDSHRLIIGAKMIDLNNFRASLVIDDTKLLDDELFTVLGIVDFNYGWRLREISFDDHGTTISNFSVEFNQDFPDDIYISKTWVSLTTPYVNSYNSAMVKRSSAELTSQVLDDAPGTTIALLDSLLILGCKHRVITNIVVTDGVHVEAFIGPHPGAIYELHTFYVGDMAHIQGSTQNSVNGFWKITEITGFSIKFTIVNTATDETGDYMIVKKSAFGGGAWQKSYISNGTKVSYQSLDPSSYDNYLIVDDIYPDAARVTIGGLVGNNITLYWRRDLKTNRTTWIRWAAVGDSRRFYLFIAYRKESPTNASVCAFGDIQDLVDSIWRTILIGQKNDKNEILGFNFAFLYPEWSIMPSGHLLCQANKQTASDTRWIRNDNSRRESIMGYTDNGHHIYPIPHPIVDIT